MAKTKADLEKQITELEEENRKLLNILNEDNQKYSELVEQKTSEFHKLPEYQQMKRDIAQLEEIKKANEVTIQHKEKTERNLRNKIQELLAENKQLKNTAEGQVPDIKELQDHIQELLEENKHLKEKLISQTVASKPIHNVRGAGRKAMSEERLLLLDSLIKQGKKEQEICELMNISKSTFYRVKKKLL